MKKIFQSQITSRKLEKKDNQEKTDDNLTDEDEFNLSLAKMEEEIRPKIINILEFLIKIIQNLKNIKVSNLSVY